MSTGTHKTHCQACWRNDPSVPIAALQLSTGGSAWACVDPVTCRLAATKAGIYGITTPVVLPK